MEQALRVHEFGARDAPPLLAVHGVTGYGQRFARLAAEQLSGFRVLAPDLRGHGESVRVPPWTLEQHAADLLAVMDRADISSLPVVGHSFGGSIGVHLARLAPGRVSKLVLLDPSIGVKPERALEGADKAFLTFADREAAAQRQRDSWTFADEDLIEEELRHNLVEIDGRWHYRYHPAAVATAWSEICRAAPLPPADLPTLLVHALREDFVSQEFVNACRFTLADKFVYHGLDANHMLYYERADEVGALITAFLGSGPDA